MDWYCFSFKLGWRPSSLYLQGASIASDILFNYLESDHTQFMMYNFAIYCISIYLHIKRTNAFWLASYPRAQHAVGNCRSSAIHLYLTPCIALSWSFALCSSKITKMLLNLSQIGLPKTITTTKFPVKPFFLLRVSRGFQEK